MGLDSERPKYEVYNTAVDLIVSAHAKLFEKDPTHELLGLIEILEGGDFVATKDVATFYARFSPEIQKNGKTIRSHAYSLLKYYEALVAAKNN